LFNCFEGKELWQRLNQPKIHTKPHKNYQRNSVKIKKSAPPKKTKATNKLISFAPRVNKQRQDYVNY